MVGTEKQKKEASVVTVYIFPRIAELDGVVRGLIKLLLENSLGNKNF